MREGRLAAMDSVELRKTKSKVVVAKTEIKGVTIFSLLVRLQNIHSYRARLSRRKMQCAHEQPVAAKSRNNNNILGTWLLLSFSYS